ncbi:MAG: hypothetical protein HY758_01680, partial [Nitrospirae bacterium]|nr:hypothetical protein [Nitrospirota bacterium]
NDKDKKRIVPVNEFVCFSVQLSVGMNKIDITAVKNGKPADKQTLSVFRRSDLISEFRNVPADFQKKYFHMTDNSKCAACHKLEPSEADKKPVAVATFAAEASAGIRGKDTASAASTCYSCHKGITSYPYVHGPASVWSCLSCHDVQANPIYIVKKPDTDICFNCHSEQKEEWGSKKRA